MGSVPTFTIKKQADVGRYTIHGWYGFGTQFVTVRDTRFGCLIRHSL